MKNTLISGRGEAAKFGKALKKSAGWALTALAAFALSKTPLFGITVPFSVSLTAASGGTGVIFAAAGSAAGMLFLSGTERVAALSVLAGVCLLKAIFVSLIMPKNEKAAATAAVFAMCAVSRAAVIAAAGFSADTFINGLCHSLLTAGAVPVFHTALFALRRGVGTYLPDRVLTCCCCASAGLLLSSLSGISAGGIKPFAAAAIFAVMLGGALCGAGSGAAAGTAAAVSLAAAGEPLILCLCLPAAGTAAGLPSPGRRGVSAGAALTVCAGFSLLEADVKGAAFFVEAAAAALLLISMPPWALMKLRTRLLAPELAKLDETCTAVPLKLRGAAAAVENVSQCIKKVTEGLEGITPDNAVLAAMRVRERVCGDCPFCNKSGCPDRGRLDRAAALTLGGREPLDSLGELFADECPRIESVCEALDDVRSAISAAAAIDARSERCRELTCGAFSAAARLLAEISVNAAENAKTLSELEAAARRHAEEAGAAVKSISVTESSEGGIKIDLTAALSVRLSPGKLGRIFQNALSLNLSPPRVSEAAGGTRIIFEREPVFTLRIGSASRAAGGGLCGDNYRCFVSGGAAYIVLSDGMGTGGRAAVDAAMTVELFSRLIKAGLSPDIALEMTAAAINVRGGEEASVTLDAAVIDLFTGKTVIYKAGAAPTYCTRRGAAKVLEAKSMPLGILQEARFHTLNTELYDGDALLMISDGVCGGSERLSNALINSLPIENAGDFARRILEQSLRLSRSRPDDMTVIAGVLQRNTAARAKKSAAELRKKVQ